MLEADVGRTFDEICRSSTRDAGVGRRLVVNISIVVIVVVVVVVVVVTNVYIGVATRCLLAVAPPASNNAFAR